MGGPGRQVGISWRFGNKRMEDTRSSTVGAWRGIDRGVWYGCICWDVWERVASPRVGEISISDFSVMLSHTCCFFFFFFILPYSPFSNTSFFSSYILHILFHSCILGIFLSRFNFVGKLQASQIECISLNSLSNSFVRILVTIFIVKINQVIIIIFSWLPFPSPDPLIERRCQTQPTNKMMPTTESTLKHTRPLCLTHSSWCLFNGRKTFLLNGCKACFNIHTLASCIKSFRTP